MPYHAMQGVFILKNYDYDKGGGVQRLSFLGCDLIQMASHLIGRWIGGWMDGQMDRRKGRISFALSFSLSSALSHRQDGLLGDERAGRVVDADDGGVLLRLSEAVEHRVLPLPVGVCGVWGE